MFFYEVGDVLTLTWDFFEHRGACGAMEWPVAISGLWSFMLLIPMAILPGTLGPRSSEWVSAGCPFSLVPWKFEGAKGALA